MTAWITRTFLLLCVFFLLAAPASAAELRVGILMGFTGPLASLAPAIEGGALLAVDQMNAAGGIQGQRVRAISRDTALDASIGRDAAAKLVQVDRVAAIVGALSSGVSTAVSSVTITNRTVLISPSATAPSLTTLKDKDYFFRTCPSDALQGRVMGELVLEQNYRNVGVLYVNNPYGKGLAENFRRVFEARSGTQVTMMVAYEENKSSYRAEAETLLRSKPEVIHMISYPADGNKQLVSLIEQGYQGKFIFSDGMKAQDVGSGPAQRFIDGSYGTAASSRESEATRSFQADYAAFNQREQRKVDPSSPYSREAYDAMSVILLAIASIGSRYTYMPLREQGRAIRTHIRRVSSPGGVRVGYGEFKRALQLLGTGKRINYDGLSGPITFDKNGDIEESVFEIWRFQNGQAQQERIVK